MILRAEAKARFHHKHPLHVAMHQGTLTREQLRAWVANAYYYQSHLPLIDALILAKSDDRDFRKKWIERIHHQDDDSGELVLWERLGLAVGLTKSELAGHEAVLPKVEELCDEYVERIAESSLLAAVAASLTDQLEPPLLNRRVEAFKEHYPWVPAAALQCFKRRATRAKADGAAALAFVLELAKLPAHEEVCIEAIDAKTDLLWKMLDEVAGAYGMGWTEQRPRLASRARLLEDSDHGGAFILAEDRGARLDSADEVIVRLCDGTRTIDGIIAALAAARPEVGRDVLQRDVLAVLDRLIERRVIEMSQS